MVKKQDKKQGGAIDLGTVATPLVLYGIHSLLKEDKPVKPAVGPKPRRGFAKRGGDQQDQDQQEEKQQGGKQQQDQDQQEQQDGGKKKQQRKQKGGEQQDQDQKEQQDGGKKKQQRKQKGGEQQDQQEQQDGGKKKRQSKQKGGEQQDQDQQEQQQDGGKKKQQRKQKGGEAQEQQDLQQDLQLEQEGGKKKSAKKGSKQLRKQKGGDAFAALEDYYMLPLAQPAPVVDATDVATQDAGVSTPAVPPATAPVVQEGGKKKAQKNKKAKKGGAGLLDNMVQELGLGQVNYDQFGNLAAESFEQDGGSLEHYTQQLEQLSQRLDKLIREGGARKQKKGRSAKKGGAGGVGDVAQPTSEQSSAPQEGEVISSAEKVTTATSQLGSSLPPVEYLQYYWSIFNDEKCWQQLVYNYLNEIDLLDNQRAILLIDRYGISAADIFPDIRKIRPAIPPNTMTLENKLNPTSNEFRTFAKYLINSIDISKCNIDPEYLKLVNQAYCMEPATSGGAKKAKKGKGSKKY